MKYLSTLLLACSLSAPAAILVTIGHDGDLPDNYVVFNGGGASAIDPVVGRLNSTDNLVGFTSSDALTVPDQGPARVEALDGSFQDLSFYALSTHTFGVAIFNLNVFIPQNQPQPQDGQVTFTFIVEGDGLVNGGTFDLSASGVNRFNIQGNAGERIMAVQFITTTPLADLRQLRIGEVPPSGNDPGGDPVIPEPLSMGLFASGLGLLGLIRKYRKA